MSVKARQQSIDDFSRRPEVAVLLVSLKAASLGVNLVSANHVVLLGECVTVHVHACAHGARASAQALPGAGRLGGWPLGGLWRPGGGGCG